jgi:hypothetical protein
VNAGDNTALMTACRPLLMTANLIINFISKLRTNGIEYFDDSQAELFNALYAVGNNGGDYIVKMQIALLYI